MAFLSDPELRPAAITMSRSEAVKMERRGD
jgi:hypothetical protein